MSRVLAVFAVLLLIESLSSCRLYRRITGKKSANADSTQVVALDTVIRQDSAVAKVDAAAPAAAGEAQRALITALSPYWNRETQWTTFNGKAKVHFQGRGEDREFPATIRMEKEKSIWMSVSMLGIEVARVMITPDTIQIILRLQKELRVIPFSEASSLLPVNADFAMLQKLLIGDVLQTGRQPNMAVDSANLLTIGHAAPDLNHSLQFNRQDTSLSVQALLSSGFYIQSEYGDYEPASGRPFAKKRIMALSDKQEQYQVDMEFSRAAFDEPIEMPFATEKYDRK